ANVTVNVNSSVLSQLYSIDGSNSERVQTADANLDLTHTAISGAVTVTSSNVTGTVFTVADVTTGLHVTGGTGNDTLIGQNITFTAGQRAAIFAGGSIETIQDQTGTYTIPIVALTLTPNS